MQENFLTVYCDGGARGNPGPAASAFVVLSSKGEIVGKQGKKIGETTNNVAEYKAVLFALEWLVGNSYTDKEINFNLDSLLVVNQLTGKYKIKNKNLMELVFKIKQLEKKFSKGIFYKGIPREKNKITDSLVNQTLDE